MKKRYAAIVLLITLTTLGLSAQTDPLTNTLQKLKWRAVGPANMGGRVTDIVGIPGDPSTFYVAGADGGVFKTTNGGVTMEALFTDQPAYSVGALAVAPSDHEVIWLGSGEGDPRNSVGYGKGVFRSTDGGKSWSAAGLPGTDRIKRLVVHPQNPEVACVCALGREWGPNEERGVFRTQDGGKSWEKVLYIDATTGCSDLAMDPSNPRILYAGMWTFSRKPWRFDDGGKETGVYRSMDGGTTWKKIHTGLPDKPMARPGLAIAASQPNTIFLLTEFPNTSGTLFRSDDRGDNWRLVNKDPNINFRPFYYSDIRVDPNNPEVLYTLSGSLNKSTDGGRTFRTIGRGVHGDHQSFWIDPLNSKRLLSGSDGGFQVSFDAGDTWDIVNNVELSQFYQIFVDNQQPYNLYGGLQDNGTWVGPSNSLHEAGILKRHWKQLAGGDGYYAVPIPGSEHEIYANLQGGVIFHVDTRTGNVRNIHPYPNKTGSAGDAIESHRYRFNWDSPIHVSPNDPNTVYTGGNVLFRSRDKGNSWDVISPDLTTNDKSKQATSGGEIYQDNTAAEFHCTILTIAESPKDAEVIWCGTDDGQVQLTRNGGKTWTNVKNNIKGLPANAWVGKIHASEHQAGTAFVAVDNHRSDDYNAYAFMTTDFGKTWTKISTGLPMDWVYVVRQDPQNPNLLYAGMEHGIYASWDLGKSWSRLNGQNLPPVSVRDLRVQARDGDLIIGTHGRGAWILDDIRPLQNWQGTAGKPAHVFESRPAIHWQTYGQIENLGDRTYVASNPADGAYVNYFLAKDAEAPVKLTIRDAQGRQVRQLTDSTAKAGLNRLIWDLRREEGVSLNEPTRGWGSGPLMTYVAPGNYQAILEANGQTLNTTLTVTGDPRLDMTPNDYQAQEKALLTLSGLHSRVNELLNTTEQVVKQLDALQEKLRFDGGKKPEAPIQTLLDEVAKAKSEVVALRNTLRRPPPAMSYRQRPELREEIRSLLSAINNAMARPTQQQEGRMSELETETEQAWATYTQIAEGPLAKLNEKVRALPAIATGIKP